ncbi:MAG: YgiQ family radical SAM protein [Clostridiales bacterium]|nr:YgiQ family radical SAM protein [Clostridiales bacterium]
MDNRGFFPISKEDLIQRGIKTLDFVLVSGDAYVDHPSFGACIIGKVLEAAGYTVGIIAQPDWANPNAFTILGCPRLAFLVTSGNIDSMVNHYSVAKKRRQKDYYSPGGEMGKRPDRAVTAYCNQIRANYSKTPIIIGGIEASLRRLAHYDYWDNKVRKSILAGSGADLLVYGMGESPIVEIADCLNSGLDIKDITYVKGTAYKSKSLETAYDYIMLPSFKDVSTDKNKYCDSFLLQYKNTCHVNSKTLVEPYNGYYIIQNTPTAPLARGRLDLVYSLPYERAYHPIYEKMGGVPAIEEVKFSLISNRGCFGSCNFCALAFHQGRVLQSRSHQSILREAEEIAADKDFKGYIHDVGGPTANFREPSCGKQMDNGVCKEKQCLYPSPCKNLNATHKDYLSLLRKLRGLPKVKKVFIRSGIRFDYLMADKENGEFFKELCEHHVSGQLKVAPEHVSHEVLKYMGKPKINIFESFSNKFYKTNEKLNKKQYLVPYLMSSHPGSDINSAIELALYLKKRGITPEQVQDFYPTPGTLSTCMYYTEMDPFTRGKVFVEKNPHNKAIQRALMQYKLPQNHSLVIEGLKQAGREDLIGFSEHCLIKPRQVKNKNHKSILKGRKR